MIDILFFGRMADIANRRATRMDFSPDIGSLLALRNKVFGDAVDEGRVRLSDIHMSVNQASVRQDQALSDGDEVAFYSVFSGG